jgi:hypothetical protein
MDAKVDNRTLTMALAGIRLGIGGALVVAPQFATRLWIGPGTEGAGTRVLARAIGARDVVLGYRTLQAVRSGEPAAGWLELGAMADAADTVAGLLAIRGIPGHRRFTMPLVAGAVGAACFWAARQGTGDASSAARQAAPEPVADAPDGMTEAPDVIELDELLVEDIDLDDGAGDGPGAMDDDDVLGDEATADLLGVALDRLEVLVADGVLEPIGHDPRRFRRTDILATRIAGG